MDDFGVLTERFGLKPQGKSAPMAASKRSGAASNGTTRSFGSSSGQNSKPSSYNQDSSCGGFPDDVLFQSKSQTGFDDFFGQFQSSTNESSNGSSLDYDYIFISSANSGSKSHSYNDDDVFGLKTRNDDTFGSFVSQPKKSDSVDDLLGGFGGADLQSKSSEQKVIDFDDLIPGFGASSSSNNGTHVETNPAYAFSDSFADPLEELGKLTQSQGRKVDVPAKGSTTLKPPPKPAQVLKADKVSSIEELEDFAMGRVQNSADGNSVRNAKESMERPSAKTSKYREAEDAAQKAPKRDEDDPDSFFSMGSRSSSVPKSRATTLDPVLDANINGKGSDVVQEKSSGSSSNLKKASSTTNIVNDFSSVFGGMSAFGNFEEYEGESEERRRARWGRQQRTQDRLNKAVADLNQRDFQMQQEQEERHRIADSLDANIKRWAAGKEGNMRALLSSLHYVLWAECGWEPVSIPDLITSSSVKKIYRKATLCVHPDKVQQKGATVQQKYTAEKVFDILKEAWNKFNKEELS